MYKSVLLPVDLAENSGWEKSLEFAKGLAGAVGAEIHVASVLPDFGMAIVGGYFETGYEEKALHALGEKVNAFVADNFDDKIKVTPHVLRGPISTEILNAADRLGCDCIVMTAHRPDLTDFLLGSNASRIVNHAKQSVVVVRD